MRTKSEGAFRHGGAICALRARAPCCALSGIRCAEPSALPTASRSFARRGRSGPESRSVLPRVKNKLSHVFARRYSGDMPFLPDNTSGFGEPTELQLEQLSRLREICSGADVTISHDEIASMLHRVKTRDEAIDWFEQIILRKLTERRDSLDFTLDRLKQWRAGECLLDHAAAPQEMPTDCALTT